MTPLWALKILQTPKESSESVWVVVFRDVDVQALLGMGLKTPLTPILRELKPPSISKHSFLEAPGVPKYCSCKIAVEIISQTRHARKT